MMRLLPRVMTVLAIVPALAAQQPSAGVAAADEWPQFRGSPRLTGVSAGAPPDTLKVLWTYEAGDVIESSAAIADGIVYVGGGNGDLVALDLATGTLRWKYATGNLIGESSPAVADGIVYIGDLGGVLHAVSARDGKALWTFKTASEIKSSPVVVSDVVLIGSYDGYLYALEARTGRERWKVLTQGRCTRRPPSVTASRSSPGATPSSAPSGLPTARQLFEIESAPTPAPRRSSTATARTSARSTTRCSRST